MANAANLRPTSDCPPLPPAQLHEVENVLARMSPRKAVGPDGLHMATMQALGEPAALLVQTLLNVTRSAFRAPTALKGGRIQDIWKGKGDKLEPAKSRGILIQNHLGKIHGLLLKDGLGDTYANAVDDAQCGCVPGRGTTHAAMMASLFTDHCAANGLSCA